MKIRYLLTLVLILAGCGGGSSSGGSGLIGFWAGSISSTVIAFNSPMTLNITTDNGVNINGFATVNNSPCFAQTKLAGYKSAINVTVGLVNGTNILNSTALSNGYNLSGTYVVTSGACLGDRGTFSVTRS